MGPWEKSSCLGLTQLHHNLASTELNNRQIAWENSRLFSTPPLVSLWNDVWEMTAEISYCWGAWEVLLIGHKWRENCSQKHYSDLGSDTRRRLYEISAVIFKRHLTEKLVLASPNFGCFLQVTIEIVVTIKILTIATKEKVSTYTGFHNTRQLGLTTMHRTQFNFKVSKSVG